MSLYREMILNVDLCAGMHVHSQRWFASALIRNQRPFRHWSDALTDTGADPELWDGGGGGFEFWEGSTF